ncbi:MAG: trigger factor [Bacillota bacterium]
MKAQLEKIEQNRVMLEVEVEADVVDKALDLAYKKLVNKVNIPGFRKGKAPRRLLENYIGKESLYSEALDSLVPQAYVDAVKDTAIQPIDEPQVDVIKIEEGQPLIFKAAVDVKPEVALGEYKGVQAEQTTVNITDQDVDNYLANLQQRYAKMVVVAEGAVQEGDTTVIDFEGSVDGNVFPGGKGENYSLVIGSGSFIPGFEAQLVGALSGDDREINVTFPGDYHKEELQGKEAVFQVAVREIKRKELSPIDDEFAKDVSEFETLEELRADIENKLKQAAQDKAEQDLRNQIINKVVEQATVEIPAVMIERRMDSFVDNMRQRLAPQGLTLEKYLEFSQSSLDDLRNQFRSEAEKSVKTDLVLEAVASIEGIEATEDSIVEEINKMAENFHQDPQTLRLALESRDQMDTVKYGIKMEQAIRFVLDNAEVSVLNPTAGSTDASPAEEKQAELTL